MGDLGQASCSNESLSVFVISSRVVTEQDNSFNLWFEQEIQIWLKLIVNEVSCNA